MNKARAGAALALGLAMSILLVPVQLGLSIFAQGSLTPPGAPAATMRSLDQIEPRTPISSLPFTISNSGSYYLTKNLSVSNANGITINATNVDLDLCGFTISSTTGSGTNGIILGPFVDAVTIKNGSVSGGTGYNGSSFSGSGFANGISGGASSHHGIHVSYVSVLGVSGIGIDLINGTTTSSVDHCHVSVSAGSGLFANTVSDCTAEVINSNTAIFGSTVINSFGQGLNADGIHADDVMNCVGISVGGAGIYGVTVTNSSGTSTSHIGIFGTNITNSVGTTTSGSYAIQGLGTISFSRGTANGSGTGISAPLVIGCTAVSTSGTAVSAGNKYLMP
jgi:hypothetical protein